MDKDIKNITPEEFHEFYEEYFSKPKPRNLRFGQAFIGKLMPKVTDPEVFYCTNDEKTIKIIYEKYVRV